MSENSFYIWCVFLFFSRHIFQGLSFFCPKYHDFNPHTNVFYRPNYFQISLFRRNRAMQGVTSFLATCIKIQKDKFTKYSRWIGSSIHNSEFENYLGQMYSVELEIKDTTESNTSAPYLDLLLSIGRDGQLHTFHLWKTWRFQFPYHNFPFLSSNIPASATYGVFISQLIRYARACSSFESFILRATWLSKKHLEQEYVEERLKSSLKKFYGRNGDLIKQFEVPLSRILNDIL